MSQYALFLGCMIPIRLPYMEHSARELLKRFDTQLVEMSDAGCCPEPSLKSLDQKTWMALAARNLTMAEDMDLNILTLCNGCFETLKTVNVALKEDGKLKAEINDRLTGTGREYKGTVDVKHLVEILAKDIGMENLAEVVKKPLKGLRVAAHYGCHLLRPSPILKVDDPISPMLLDKLIELTGASSIPYYKKNLCCGAGVGGVNPDVGKELVKYKLGRLERAKVDCMTVVCPYCMLQYDVTQTLVRNDQGERFNIPVLYYPEMLLMAMDVPPEQIPFDLHRVKMNPVLEKIYGVV